MRRAVSLSTTTALCSLLLWLGCAPRRIQTTTVSPSEVQARFTQLVMASPMRITVNARDAEHARTAASAAYARAIEVENALSDWQPNSAVCRLPEHAGQPTVVTGDLATALEWSSAVQRATDGAFDPALGALTQLWREARASGTRPSDALAAQARARSGWSHVRWNGDTRTIEFDCDGVRLDFGGIGKGLASTEALMTLEREGCLIALVSLDGDVACGAAPNGRTGWRVRVDSGVDGDPGCLLSVTHCAVSTSGDRQQSMEVDGERITHIIDPLTVAPRQGHFAATVVAPHGATADALATAIAARPALMDRVDELRAALGPFEARLVTVDSNAEGRSTARVRATEGWKALVATDAPASAPSPAAAAPSSVRAGTSPPNR